MANHLRSFPEASDGPEWQEQSVWAVGGQGELQGVTQHLSKIETWFFFNQGFLCMANHLGQFPEASDGPEWQEQPVQAVGGEGQPHGVPC